jgi:hypothetical protein
MLYAGSSAFWNNKPMTPANSTARAPARKPNGKASSYAPRKTIPLVAKSDDTEEIGRTYAKQSTGGAFAALRVIRAADHSAGYERDLDLPALMATLQEQGETVNAGNLAQAEAMLMNQATALQTLFARLAERGMGCNKVVPFETNMRIALRAQSQCRATLETLAALKNPPVVIAKQANVTTGPQQVNNGVATAPPRARENEITPNKLLEASYGERLDTGTTGAAAGANPRLEAVGAVNGTEDRRG